MKLLIVFAVVVTITLAEPPAPNSQYLPSNNYGPPSTNYGAPGGATTAILKPNNQYGAPSRGKYLPPNGGGYGGGNNGGGHGGNNGGGYGGNNGGGYGGGNGGGYGGGYGDQSEPANYHFKYDVQDPPSGNDFGHEEQRQGDVAQGRYYVLLPDGRRQVVEYVADNEGYKPKISYEQVGGGNGGGYPSGGGGYANNGNGGYNY